LKAGIRPAEAELSFSFIIGELEEAEKKTGKCRKKWMLEKRIVYREKMAKILLWMWKCAEKRNKKERKTSNAQNNDVDVDREERNSRLALS
jgi:hypothetical protein